jgi:hypothetical protein
MTKPLGAFDEAQGSPNLSALQFLGENLKPDQIVNVATAIPVTINADATGGLDVLVPFDCTVFDVIVQASGSSGSGSVTLSNDGDAVSNAIAMETDKAITRAGTLDLLYTKFSKDDYFTFTTNGAADKGLIKILVVKS